MGGVGGVRKPIHQSWLAIGLGLLCWYYQGVQEEIPSEEASTLQIGSMAVTKVIDTLTQEDIHVTFQKLLERYNKFIVAGGEEYIEGD